MKVGRPQKWLFWLILGVFSAIFAELPSGSFPNIFTDPWGLLVVIPLYSLHILVLAPLVIRPGKRTNLFSLFMAGTIFGLYEAYITKVLWEPPWNPEAFRIGGVAVFSSIVLVLYWHVFWSFILPLYAAQSLLVQKTLPAVQRGRLVKFLGGRRGFFVLAILAGVFHGAAVQSWQKSLLSSLPTCLVIFLLVWIWFKRPENREETLAELLPRGKSWRYLFVLLLLFYLISGFLILPEKIPGWQGHLSIFVLYALFLSLLFLARDKQETIPKIDPQSTLPIFEPQKRIKTILAVCLAFILSSAAAAILLAIFYEQVSIFIWTSGIAIGLFSFYKSLRFIFGRNN